MSKVGVITDIHWGCRNDSAVFIDYLKQFYEEVFFPELQRREIDTLLILGDTFDRRKYISFITLDHAKRIFFDQLQARGIKCFVLTGNHDAPYKNSIKINSVRLLLREYDNVFIIDEPSEIEVYGSTICAIPWICADNAVDALTLLESTKATICVGHFEITGFAMYRGTECKEGLERGLFQRFEMILSGHYHHRSSDHNIHYLGNPYEITWQDYNDPRGFHILDLSTRTLEFIANPHKMFHKVHYDDQKYLTKDDLLNHDFTQYKGKYVKVVVHNKLNTLWFDMFIDHLEKADAADIQVVDDHLYLNLEDDSEIISGAEDTLTTLTRHISSFSGSVDKPKLEQLLHSLYHEALSLQ